MSVRVRTAKPKLPPVGLIAFLMRIRGGLQSLARKMVPPEVALLETLAGFMPAQSISVAAKIGLADHMSLETPTPSKDLAAKVGANEDALYRLMRGLTVAGLFSEGPLGSFRLTPMGATLRTDHPQSMRYFSIYQGQLNWDNWGALEYCVRTGKNAVEHLHGMKSFEYISGTPERADIFDRGMVNISDSELDPILAVYDFSRFKTIADIAGGLGPVLASILMLNPGAKGILFDLPITVEGAKSFIKSAGLQERVEIVAGNFFESVPAGADAYIMKHIVHDWSDEEAIQIMKNIRAKIPAGGKLLLMEQVVTGPNEPHFAKYLDLEMMIATTGRERTEPEYRALLEKAGFRLDRIVPTIGLTSIIEASPA